MEEEKRPDPEKLLQEIKDAQENKNKGKLKIFFGYSAGVGKTYAMLEEAHTLKKSGVDVVIGYVEPHQRPETSALIKGLPQIPPYEIEYGGTKLREFDIDSALKRHPQLILVDELAHTNVKGSRHTKRYQDIEELLRMGIDVYTTINVQHIEGLHDVVESITGVAVRERIPDSVFDSADKVELADIEPEDLINRLAEGKIYQEKQAKRALENFFTKENLVALREIALRRTADRLNISVEKNKISTGNDSYFTDEHIMMCLSSSPTNAGVIRTAAKMADAFHADFTAIFVETALYPTISDDNKKRLQDNIRLAEQLGAKVVTIYGDDVPFHMAEYAKASGISKIVIGRSVEKQFLGFAAQNYIDKLISYAPNIDVYVIPNRMGRNFKALHKKNNNYSKPVITLGDSARMVLCLTAATAVGLLFHGLGFGESNIISVYILAAMFSVIITKGKIYALFSSIMSVLLFKFFFTEPYFTFKTHDESYIVTFAVMFLSALTVGAITKKIKEQGTQTASKAYRTELLFETSRKLQKAKDKNEILAESASQIRKLFNSKNVFIYYAVNGELQINPITDVEDTQSDLRLLNDEFAVAQWVFANNKSAGASTDTLSGSKYIYMPVSGKDTVFAVAAIQMQQGEKLGTFEQSLLTAMLSECALMLEKENINDLKNEIMLQASSEKLRSNLLRSISHDLRTPLTGIAGGSAFLLENIDTIDKGTIKSILSDISGDSLWLSDLVENLLHMTRIQDGRLSVTKKKELADELISSAVAKAAKRSPDKSIVIKKSNDTIFVPVDTQLIMQVIINLIDNSFKHTKAGSHVEITYRRKNNDFILEVSDDGGGIPEEFIERVFDPFFTQHQTASDKHRGTGLGLSICKSIIESHGGTINAENNKQGGATIRFTLPLE